MSKKIRAMYKKAGVKAPNGKGIHTEKFHRCVIDVTKKGGAANPHAVCMASIGKEKAVKKSHQKNSPTESDVRSYVKRHRKK